LSVDGKRVAEQKIAHAMPFMMTIARLTLFFKESARLWETARLGTPTTPALSNSARFGKLAFALINASPAS